MSERAGLRIHEVPVDWVDDPDSRVELLPTALADLRGIGRLLVRRRPGASLPAPVGLRRSAAVQPLRPGRRNHDRHAA